MLLEPRIVSEYNCKGRTQNANENIGRKVETGENKDQIVETSDAMRC